MEITNPDIFLVRAGFVLFMLALLTGFLIPMLLNKKMALAAHVTGIMNALVLIALGLAWGLLTVSPLQADLTRGAFLYGTNANWVVSCLAAAWGTSRLTPLAGAGYGAAPWKEAVVQVLQASLALAILAGSVLVVYALRKKPAAPSHSIYIWRFHNVTASNPSCRQCHCAWHRGGSLRDS